MTVIPERRGGSDFLYLFLAGVALAAGLRAYSPVASVVCIVVAAAIVGFWIYQRRMPPFSLTVGTDEIVWGRRGDERRKVIARAETGWVRIEPQSAGVWFLTARDGDEEGVGIMLDGFNLALVADACEAHGWPLSMLGRADSSDDGGA